MGYYGAVKGISLSTLEGGTDRLSRNVIEELPLLCVIIQKSAFVISKFCGWFGSLWMAGGGRDPGPVNLWSLLILFARPWELESFSCPGDSLWPSWVLERWWWWWWWQVAGSGTLAILTHTRRGRKCIAGLRFVLIPQPSPWTGSPHPPPPPPWNR